MNRHRLLAALGVLLLAGALLDPHPARAQTCEPVVNVPDYSTGNPAPVVCDLHGAQHVVLRNADGGTVPATGTATASAPTLAEGSPGSFSFDLKGNARVFLGTATAAAPSISEGVATTFSYDLAGNARVTLGTLISGEDQTNNLIRTSGGAIRISTVMTGVTTNTTSATTTVFSGAKTPMASVTGTGALTATVQFYGDMENTTTHGEVLCPAIVLSGTTKAVGFCPQITKDYPFYHAVTTAITGTSATVEATIVTGAAASNARQEWLSSGIKTADALIKTGAGWLQCIWVSQNDAAPTAGTISVNDAVSAGTGTAIFKHELTTAVFNPFQICPQVPFTTGLYFDFTTVADVNVNASYR